MARAVWEGAREDRVGAFDLVWAVALQASHRAATVLAFWLCRATGQAGGPGTAWCLGPGRHGHIVVEPDRAVGRAKIPCHGPCQRATGRMAIYRKDTSVLQTHTK